jgi:hypothetical protein
VLDVRALVGSALVVCELSLGSPDELAVESTMLPAGAGCCVGLAEQALRASRPSPVEANALK